MAMNRLSINEVGVNQGLAQIKTGEFFIVTAIDLDAKKATLKSVAGDEKVVSKATLERWYRKLNADEVIRLGKTLKNDPDGGTEDAVHENGEPEKAEEPGKGEDADADQAVAEDHDVSDTSQNGAVPESAEAEERDPGERQPAPETAGRPGDCGDAGDGGSAEAGGADLANDCGSDGVSESGDDAVHAPVTPSNAGKDKDKAKTPKKQEPKNAALMKVRQTIIDTVLADSNSIQLKQTSSYDVLKEKHNFAEITHGSNRFNVSIISKSLTEDQLGKVKVNPASFGWSIDADFTVFDESDIETAVQLIRQSREYRLAHPVTRKKKSAEAGK